MTLSIGIMTSMLTAIVGTRVDLLYGGRRLERLPIGGRRSAGAAV